MFWLKIFLSSFLSMLYMVNLHYVVDMYLLSSKKILLISILLFLVIVFTICYIFKNKSKVMRFIVYSCYFIVVVINIFLAYYLYTTSSFIESFDNTVDDKNNYYYLITLKDSNINDINDLINKDIGMTDNTSNLISEKIEIEYKKVLYQDVNKLVNDLYQKKIGAILLSDVEDYILKEYDEDFSNKIKIIKTYNNMTLNNEDNKKEKKPLIAYEPFVLYISGIDNDGNISRRGRSDVNILMTVNPKTKQILLTSIPRDYYVQLNGTTGIRDKLTHAGIYGVDKSILTIEDLLGVDINYYVKVNFNTAVRLIDAIDGINVYSEKNLNFCNIKKGNNYLNGSCALRFVRERKSFGAGDRQRGRNQEKVIEAIIEKLSSSNELLYNYTDILNSLKNNFITDVSPEQIKQLVGVQINKSIDWDIRTINLDGYNSYNYTYSGGNMVLWVMEPDINTVNNARVAITEVLNGKKFSDILVLN